MAYKFYGPAPAHLPDHISYHSLSLCSLLSGHTTFGLCLFCKDCACLRAFAAALFSAWKAFPQTLTWLDPCHLSLISDGIYSRKLYFSILSWVFLFTFLCFIFFLAVTTLTTAPVIYLFIIYCLPLNAHTLDCTVPQSRYFIYNLYP